GAHCGTDAVRGKHANHRFFGSAIGDFVQLADKNCTTFAEAVHHELVMHNFFAHINGTGDFEGFFHNINRAHHACAKAAWSHHENFSKDMIKVLFKNSRNDAKAHKN